MSYKTEILQEFREAARKPILESKILMDTTSKETQKTKELNNILKEIKQQFLERIVPSSFTDEGRQCYLRKILTVNYASFILMLEERNKVWGYDYMSFSRRIGELWEPFCRIIFDNSVSNIKIENAISFDAVKDKMQQDALAYINLLPIQDEEKSKLRSLYLKPWEITCSGDISLKLDLHFTHDGILHNCDFKSGFSSNEKGNTNRLLQVGSILNTFSSRSRNILFVRQTEEENNHYLARLRQSDFWEVYCADEAYDEMFRLTKFDIQGWIKDNMDWQEDLSPAFVRYLRDKKLMQYLLW